MSESPSAPPGDLLLSTRRALMGDPVSVQVHDWLRPVYQGPIRPAQGSLREKTEDVMSAFTQMAGALRQQLSADQRLNTALRSVTDCMSSTESGHYRAAFESIKRTGSTSLKTFVSIIYARAVLLLVSSKMTGSELLGDLGQKLSNPAASIEQYLAAQNKLSGDFIGHLVVFSEIEARIDPTFAKILDGAAALFLNHKPQGSTTDPLSDPRSTRDVLRDESETAWWRVPAALAFAMGVAPQPAAA